MVLMLIPMDVVATTGHRWTSLRTAALPVMPGGLVISAMSNVPTIRLALSLLMRITPFSVVCVESQWGMRSMQGLTHVRIVDTASILVVLCIKSCISIPDFSSKVKLI